MRNNNKGINVETKSDRLKKMTKLHSIHLDFTLQYIPLTSYNIVKDKFK